MSSPAARTTRLVLLAGAVGATCDIVYAFLYYVLNTTWYPFK